MIYDFQHTASMVLQWFIYSYYWNIGKRREIFWFSLFTLKFKYTSLINRTVYIYIRYMSYVINFLYKENKIRLFGNNFH